MKMSNKQQLSLYGLKWNPFVQDIPPEALIETEATSNFIWKVENLVMDGGFAMITGDPGVGKSVVLRMLSERLKSIRDVRVATLTRPQSSIADFYRELGFLFDIELRSSNRYGGYRGLRDKWKHHIDSTLLKPVLLIDEAQEMLNATLSELRMLSSISFDSQNILTVVLCGDRRLGEKFRSPDLLPLGSRIRARYPMDSVPKSELASFLKEAITAAGNTSLLTADLIQLLADRSVGNYRIMMTMASELLMEALKTEKSVLDEQLFFDTFKPNRKPKRREK
jgi:type II secretory pathway predicted ATPase ExeA